MAEAIQHYDGDGDPEQAGWYIVYLDGLGEQYDAVGPYDTPTQAMQVQSRSVLDDQPEIIMAAAMRWRGAIHSVPRPGRHGDVIRFLYERHPEQAPFAGEQGFTTSRGRFVGREEAARIAAAADQLLADELERRGQTPETISSLFSEDVW